MWRALREAGVVDAIDEHLGRWLGRLGASEAVQLVGAAASHATRAGHVCVDLGERVGPVRDAEGAPVGDVCWPLAEALPHDGVVGMPGAATPLVREGSRVYLQRYFDHEVVLARALRARSTAEIAVERDDLVALVDRCFGCPRTPSGPDNDQRAACEVAATQRLCVVSGGPGTGKTTTVARMLAVITELRRRDGRDTRVRLLAPTGKAAARLGEALRAQLEALPPELRPPAPPPASTVHRALGPMRGSRTRFRHDRRAPLPDDVVVVDEASMVDLALMRRLLEAVPPRARLVLLGDRDQLASVESGAVLGEVVRGAEAHPDAPVSTRVVRLQHSFRFRHDGGIGGLARAIREGDADAALGLLANSPELVLQARPRPRTLGDALAAQVQRGFRPLCDAVDGAAAVEALSRFRLLCAHRRGPWGVEVLNPLVEGTLARAGQLAPTSGWYPRRPVLITRNDARLGLFNGDQGVAMTGPRGLRATFPDGGAVRSLSVSRLADVQTVFALSIHKSQGSEFDRVVVVLPEVGSPLLTRELLYTAVTRAKRHVTVVGEPASVRAAIDTPVVRMSGLADKLFSR